jgi:hypothetical protein
MASGTERKAIVAQGDLILSDTDGGFLPDNIEVGGMNILYLIAELFGEPLSERGWSIVKEGDSVNLGTVRLTIERITSR